MIAACPKCAARYRIERERLQAGSVRLRCARCQTVFRVRPPEAVALEPTAVRASPPALVAEPARATPPPASTVASPGAAPPVAAPAGPGPDAERVLVAMPDGDLAKRTADALARRGFAVLRACDGVEAMLEIQRRLPRAVVLAADLPKMFGFQICEVVKRNESLRGTWVVLVGAVHHPERYRREPDELYGADAYVDGSDLPEGLLPLLARGGLALAPRVSNGSARVPLEARPPQAELRAPSALPARPAREAPAPAPAAAPAATRPAAAPPVAPVATRPAAAPPVAPAATRPAAAPPVAPVATRPAPVAPSAPAATRPASRAPAAPAPKPAAPAPARPAVAASPAAGRRRDGLEDERAKAERLARIVISDIVLYNEERFAAAVRRGNVLEAMATDLAEGRQLFEERIDARVRAERDHLKDELLLRARARETR